MASLSLSIPTGAQRLSPADCERTDGDAAKPGLPADACVPDRPSGETVAPGFGSGQADGFTMSGFG
jgi:hypothetical protein